jgi:hypothetical protein
MLGRALLILTLAATTAAAQRDCLVRPNARGGTYISCSRTNDYAREMRRITSEARRETRQAANRVRAESRAATAAARAEARAFARWSDRPAMRIRERIEPLRIRRPALRYQRW